MIYLQGKPADTITTGIESIAAGHNAFSFLFEPRRQPAPIKPKKRNPNVSNSQRSVTALETASERALRRMKELATRVNRCEPLCTKSDPDRQQRIKRTAI